MLAVIMFCSKLLMEALPNIHLLGTLTMVYTLYLRRRALIPIYLYVFINGVYAGFDLWWMPYLYIWTILWGITMLLPKSMPRKVAVWVYPAVSAIHGLFYGVLYAPAQALLFHLNAEQTLVWIGAGLPFDLIHMAGNAVLGLLILPMLDLLKKLDKSVLH